MSDSGHSNDSGVRKDVADAFAVEREDAKQLLQGLKETAVDGLEIALEGVPDDPSKRRRLKYVRENVLPLILRQLEEKGLAALVEPTKDSEVLAALDDVAAATKLKPPVLKAATEEEAQRRLIKTANAARAEKKAEAAANAVPEEAYAHLLRPGVLERYLEAAARMHGVVGDEEPMKLITLVAVGAQLDLLPNGKPLGPSTMLIADPGRGKNYLTDAVVAPLPKDWYLAFESASATSMYYQAERDPDFLKHCFVYPNEIEATEMLVEFLRPMLSGGKAIRLTVNSTGANGANEGRELKVRGPITTIIPTVRNKTDDQLQTRLLMTELEDYEGRVRKHARAVSELLLPDFAASDNAEITQAWQAAFRSLTGVRRVVFPLGREEFAFDNDAVSHGARLWANLLGLMCSHAWLEQRNRRKFELSTGEQAIVAEPGDYEAAYKVFKAACQRTVVNLSDTHRKILDGVYALKKEHPDREGFSQREIHEEAEVSLGAVSKHKTFLVSSAKLLRETEHGLGLVSGAEPSWWAEGDLMHGFPRPAQVQTWWRESRAPGTGEAQDEDRGREHQKENEYSDSRETCEQREHHEENCHNPDTYGVFGVYAHRERPENGREHPENGHGSVHEAFTKTTNAENGLGKGNGANGSQAFTGFTPFTGEEEAATVQDGRAGQASLTVEEVAREIQRSKSGPALALGTYLENPNEERLMYLTKAVLVARGTDTSDWKPHAIAAKMAAEDPSNHPLGCGCEECA